MNPVAAYVEATVSCAYYLGCALLIVGGILGAAYTAVLVYLFFIEDIDRTGGP